MTIVATQLANGQLPNGPGPPLYTAPPLVVYVKNIILHNTDVAMRTCELYFVEAITGFTRIIARVELGVNYTHHCGPLVLEVDDAILGFDDSIGGNVVDYTMYGAIEA